MLMQKGTAMKSTLKFIRGKLEGERLQAFIGGLPEELRGYFKKPIFALEWYPGVPMAQIMEHFARFLGEPPHEVYRAVGRQNSDDGLNTVYKIFIRLGNPEFIIRKAPYVWTTYLPREGVRNAAHPAQRRRADPQRMPDPPRSHLRARRKMDAPHAGTFRGQEPAGPAYGLHAEGGSQGGAGGVLGPVEGPGDIRGEMKTMELTCKRKKQQEQEGS